MRRKPQNQTGVDWNEPMKNLDTVQGRAGILGLAHAVAVAREEFMINGIYFERNWTILRRFRRSKRPIVVKQRRMSGMVSGRQIGIHIAGHSVHVTDMGTNSQNASFGTLMAALPTGKYQLSKFPHTWRSTHGPVMLGVKPWSDSTLPSSNEYPET